MSSLKRDLVERRLWPVAVLLIAAIVAVPFLLHSHRSAQGGAVVPAPTPRVGTPGAKPTSSKSQPVSQHHAQTPRLHMSNSRDPFTALVIGHAKHHGPGSASKGGASSSSGSTARATVVDGNGASASTTTSPSATSTASTGEGASSSSTGTAASSSATGSETTPTPTTTTTSPAASAPTTETGSWTLYSVNLDYGVPGKATSHVNLPRLSPLPEKSPKAMFAGVADRGREAAFLIGAGVGATGQGRCHPSRRDCEMVTLSPGQSEGLYYLSKNGSGHTTILRVRSVAGHLTHSAATAQAAYDRHSALGLCDLELGDPLGVAYDPTKGALTSLDLRACRRNQRAVAFPGTTSGGDTSSVLP